VAFSATTNNVRIIDTATVPVKIPNRQCTVYCKAGTRKNVFDIISIFSVAQSKSAKRLSRKLTQTEFTLSAAKLCCQINSNEVTNTA